MTISDMRQVTVTVLGTNPMIRDISGSTGARSVADVFILNATAIDPDSTLSLSYSWTCKALANITCFDLSGNVLQFGNTKSLSFPAFTLHPDTYTFTLTVTSAEGLTATRQVTSVIMRGSPPGIAITASNTNTYVNPKDRLILSSLVTDNSKNRIDASKLTCQWSCTDNTIMAGSLTGATSTTLLLAENTMAYSSNYTFTLTCSVTGGLTVSGYNSITIK